MLRGNHLARIDEKGRLKVPTSFRELVEATYGPKLFVTSITGENVRLYPMPVWEEIERKLLAIPSTNPSRQRFLDRVNFFGQEATLDTQGRIVIPQGLRKRAALEGEGSVAVSVVGLQNYLAVWNLERLETRLFEQDPYTADDDRALAGFDI